MVGRTILCSIILGAGAAAPAQSAPAVARSVQIRSGALAEALRELARQTGAELLYDRRTVEGARSPDVRGTMLTEQALSRLLSGTRGAFRRTPDGVFVLYLRAPSPVNAEEPPVPE